MTKLQYRGHAYEPRTATEPLPTQLRYDRSHFRTSQPEVGNAQTLTYRGCRYTTEGRQPKAVTSSETLLCYRGVTYTSCSS